MGPTEAACVQIHSHASQLNCSQNVPLSDLMHISGETMWPESSRSSLKCWPEKLFGISFKFHHIYKAHTALCSHYSCLDYPRTLHRITIEPIRKNRTGAVK